MTNRRGFLAGLLASAAAGAIPIPKAAPATRSLVEDFYYGGAQVGSITTNGSAISYVTASDGRLMRPALPMVQRTIARLRVDMTRYGKRAPFA